MLSRLAESFFWLSRNVERAETVARVLDVTYTRSMDLYAGGAWSQRSWRTAIATSLTWRTSATAAPAMQADNSGRAIGSLSHQQSAKPLVTE